MRDIPPDLAPYSSDRPKQVMHLVFLHHSCGGQLMADEGDIRERGQGTCIYQTHPNGGSLRTALERNNYHVNEASYGSAIGQETDICSWRTKFRDRMDDILACAGQDERFTNGERNRVVMFKSCYPNSWIDREGVEPGDPDSHERTLANYKAAYGALLQVFAQHPGTLFVAFTAPPMVRPVPGARILMRVLLNRMLGIIENPDAVGKRVRAFNNWLKDMDRGWLGNYSLRNAVVFDYFHVLTRYGASDWSQYPTRGGIDSHPNSRGNTRAAQVFIPFLNKAVSRAGL